MKTIYALAALLACSVAGCLNQPRPAVAGPTANSVRNVRFVGMPDRPELAAKARELGDTFYPEIYSVLNDGAREVSQFDIVFRKDLARHYKRSVKRATQNMSKMNYFAAGLAARGKVYLDAKTFIDNPEKLDRTLLHEMAHLAQHYKWYRRITLPYYWEEGIAEAMVFKVESTNMNIARDRPCKCSFVMPHYRSGYSCAAAFLLYLEKFYDSKMVSRLNAALRNGSYSDDFFYQYTHRTLGELWSEFLQTAEITPMAVKINRIYAELGYFDGKPPHDVKARFKAYLARQVNGEELIRVLSVAELDDHRFTEVQGLIARSVYFAGAGGSMIEAIHLSEQGRLPGMEKNEPTIWEPSSMRDLDSQEHESPHEIRASKEGDPSIYHYKFIRACDDCAWALSKAWRTGKDGTLIEEY